MSLPFPLTVEPSQRDFRKHLEKEEFLSEGGKLTPRLSFHGTSIWGNSSKGTCVSWIQDVFLVSNVVKGFKKQKKKSWAGTRFPRMESVVGGLSCCDNNPVNRVA